MVDNLEKLTKALLNVLENGGEGLEEDELGALHEMGLLRLTLSTEGLKVVQDLEKLIAAVDLGILDVKKDANGIEYFEFPTGEKFELKPNEVVDEAQQLELGY